MRCIHEVVEQLSSTRWLVECVVCGRRVRSPSPDGVGVMCGIKIALGDGPGTELVSLTSEIGIKPKRGCGCIAMAHRMNQMQAAGCRRMRDKLVVELDQKRSLWGLTEQALIGVRATFKGYPWLVFDPCGGLIDESITRAEKKSNRLRHG
jgi:hypothetical protein